MTKTLEDYAQLNQLLACPNCKQALELSDVESVTCARCGDTYARGHHGTWQFVPPPHRRADSPEWQAWEVLQANGLATYENDPANNLGVGPREDCLSFSKFCGFHGRVLDVGCGPQAWPTYFDHHAPGTFFIGVDPLVGAREPDYPQLQALGEYLPFRSGVFDHVVFATSLDHFVDPRVAIGEALRVLKPAGTIDLWIGEKRPGAPKPKVSPSWYQAFRRPEIAEDVFHLKRQTVAEVQSILKAAGLAIEREETHRIDEYRLHYYCRARRAGEARA
jgi:SAM-dependent methyltransferase